MSSTWVAMSLISEAKVPVDWATGESRTRMRKPSVYVLDVVEQRERRLFQELARVPGGQRAGHHVQQLAHLAVHHHRVQALLAAEVLVDHRLGDPGLRRDLLHRRALEALRSANSVRPMSSSCSRRSCPVIRTRRARRGWCEGRSLLAAACCRRSPRRQSCRVGAAGSRRDRLRCAGSRSATRPASARRTPSRASRTSGSAGRWSRAGPACTPCRARGRVRVVQVVPGLAAGQDRQPPHVAGPVAGLEGALADRVADRVDRPRDVVQQRHPHERAPEERR